MAKQVYLLLSEKVKVVSELELTGVTQEVVLKKYSISTSQVSRLSKVKVDFTWSCSSEIQSHKSHKPNYCHK